MSFGAVPWNRWKSCGMLWKRAPGKPAPTPCIICWNAQMPPKHSKRWRFALKRRGRPDLAEREIRLWDLLMNILDQCAMVLQNTVLGCARFTDLLRRVIAAGQLTTIPQGLDQVTVAVRTACARIVQSSRSSSAQCRGNFPAPPLREPSSAIRSAGELIQLGLPLNDTLEDALSQSVSSHIPP